MAPTCRLPVRLQYITQPHVGHNAGERDNLGIQGILTVGHPFLPQLFLLKQRSYNKKNLIHQYTNTPCMSDTPRHMSQTPRNMSQTPHDMLQTATTCRKDHATCHKHPALCCKHPVTCRKHLVKYRKHIMTCHEHPATCRKHS